MVDWKELFLLLRKRKVEPIFLRVLIFIYRNQQCNVKWNTSLSSHFPVSNGVRQGAVSSPILFSVYINDLLVILREAGIGCHVGSFFVGCLGYADDLLLLSASRSGLQSMVNTCQKFTKKKNLKFSTNPDAAKSKTKCIVFSKKAKDLKNVSPILLNGDPLPWVQQVKHLGNVMQCDNSMKIDCTLKRGKFIGKVNSLLQEFYFADPKVKMRLMNIFAASFYGSGLWDLQSRECDRLFKSWNVTVRMVFGVPPTTHRYLIEPLAGTSHARTMLCFRYVKFKEMLYSSSKVMVNLLARITAEDMRTVMGKTMAKLKTDLNGMEVSCSNIKDHLKYFPVPELETWRIDYLEELLDAKNLVIENMNADDIAAMIGLLWAILPNSVRLSPCNTNFPKKSETL